MIAATMPSRKPATTHVTARTTGDSEIVPTVPRWLATRAAAMRTKSPARTR
jgi:hypothetical protein